MTKKTIEQIRDDFNKARNGSDEAMECCAEDISFATEQGAQWDGDSLDSDLPRPEVNKAFPKAMRLVGQLVRASFDAKVIPDSDQATQKDALNLQGLFRTDMSKGEGQEAKNQALTEMVMGGFGAWVLDAIHADEESPDNNEQYICRKPIYNACQSVVFGVNGQKKDKSDCTQSWYLISANRDSIEDEYGVTGISSFGSYKDGHNVNSYYRTNDATKDITLAHYYEVETETHIDVTITGPNGEVKLTRKSRGGDFVGVDNPNYVFSVAEVEQIKKDAENNSLIQVKQVKRKVKCCYYSLLHGNGFLIKRHKTPFKRQPIVPVYGYYFRSQGKENFFGLIRLLKDPQRYLNYYYAGLIDLLDRPQAPIPVFLNEQLRTTADQWYNMRDDNPSVLTVDPIETKDGSTQPLGPISYVQPAQVSPAMAQVGSSMDQATQELGGTGQSTLPANASGEAVAMINDRQDDVFYPMVASYIQSLTCSGYIYIDAAKEVYHSTPRSLTITGYDGKRSEITTVKETFDNGLGYENTARGKYSVEVEMGEGFESEQAAARKDITEAIQLVGTETPEGQALVTAMTQTLTGESTELSRQIARRKEITLAMQAGIEVEPKDDTEAQFIAQTMQQMQQPPEPDANMVLAQAEQAKAQAEMMKIQSNQQLEMMKMQIKQQENQIKAAEVGARINNINIDSQSKQLDNIIKLNQPIQQ